MDNRERARAIMEKECPTCGQVAIYSGGEYRPLDEEDTPAESRGRPIADDATVERVAVALAAKDGRTLDGYTGVMLSSNPPIRVTFREYYLELAEAALAAIPAPPAGESERG